MRNLKNIFQEFIEDESGLTAVEYAIAGSLVVGGMVIAFNELGDGATESIGFLCDAVTGNPSSTVTCTQ